MIERVPSAASAARSLVVARREQGPPAVCAAFHATHTALVALTAAYASKQKPSVLLRLSRRLVARRALSKADLQRGTTPPVRTMEANAPLPAPVPENCPGTASEAAGKAAACAGCPNQVRSLWQRHATSRGAEVVA